MAHIKRLVQETVSNATREFASEAARAAVHAMRAQQSPPFTVSDAILPSSSPQQTHVQQTLPSPKKNSQATPPPQQSGHVPGLVDTSCQNGAPFQDIPSTYIKDIQTGEFFALSKLLPKNLSMHDEGDNLVLSLDNSVVKVSKKQSSSAVITNTNYWTTAFTTYMSVLTQEFPLRSQELLQHLSLISYAARVHKGLSWAVYDHTLGQKASTNKSLIWSQIDSQLWLTIFTVAPSILQEEYPLFSKGPYANSVSTGAAFRGTCHSFNKNGFCSRVKCMIKNICSQCSGSHPESKCTSLSKRQRERDGDRDKGRARGGSTFNSCDRGK